MIWFLKRGNGFNKIEKHESRCLRCSPCVELIGPRAVCLDLSAWAVQGTTFLNQGRVPSLARTHCAWLILKAPVRNKAGPSLWHHCCNAVETAAHHGTRHHPKRSLGRIPLRLQTRETPTLPTGHFPPAASDSRTLRAKFPSNHISSWGAPSQGLYFCVPALLSNLFSCPNLPFGLISLSTFLSCYFIFIFISGPKSFWKHQEINK